MQDTPASSSRVLGGPARPLPLWAPVALYAAGIFLASSVHNPPALPGGLSDKVGHAVMYAGLAVLVVRACAGGQWSRVTLPLAALAVALTVAYGATDEFHQRFVAGRTPDLADLAADAAGAAAAAALVLLVARLGKSGPGARI